MAKKPVTALVAADAEADRSRGVERRPVRTDGDYRAALAEIDRLTAGDREPDNGTPDAAALEMLVARVHAYEERQFLTRASRPDSDRQLAMARRVAQKRRNVLRDLDN
jgi:antitoxin component HigA of HigAB toxin-antitoxin module